MNPVESTEAEILQATQNWIEQVVIRHQFCPFAARPFQDKTIRYHIILKKELTELSQIFLSECTLLDNQHPAETTLLIFPDTLNDFHDYLDVLADCEELLTDHNYNGIYQLASFHPKYQFAGTTPDDVTNKTNQSPYPIIQLLREKSITRVLKQYPHPENIPERNIKKAKEIWGKKK